MSENLHERRSSMRTRNFAVSTYHKLMDKLKAFKDQGLNMDHLIMRHGLSEEEAFKIEYSISPY